MGTSYESNMWKNMITNGNEEKTIGVINHKKIEELEGKALDKPHIEYIFDRSSSMFNGTNNHPSDVQEHVEKIMKGRTKL